MPFLLKIIKSFSQAKIKCYTIFAILMLNSVIISELTTANMTFCKRNFACSLKFPLVLGQNLTVQQQFEIMYFIRLVLYQLKSDFQIFSLQEQMYYISALLHTEVFSILGQLSHSVTNWS